MNKNGKQQVTVYLLRRANYAGFYVKKVTNSLEPQAGEGITEKEAQKLIDSGVTVHISDSRGD